MLCDENTCLVLNQYATLDQCDGWFILCPKSKRNSSSISKGNLNYPYFLIQLNFHGLDFANVKTLLIMPFINKFFISSFVIWCEVK